MPKKEFSVKRYSRRMFPLCTAGGIAVVLANFVQYMVKETYHAVAYSACYGGVVLIAVAIFCVRNQYDDKFYKTHKTYAVFAGLAAVVLLIIRLFRPELLVGELQSFAGNPINVNVFATFILIALIGKPMLDIVDTMKYVQPEPTHLLQEQRQEED